MGIAFAIERSFCNSLEILSSSSEVCRTSLRTESHQSLFPFLNRSQDQRERRAELV